jgi:hypothetical protein
VLPARRSAAERVPRDCRLPQVYATNLCRSALSHPLTSPDRLAEACDDDRADRQWNMHELCGRRILGSIACRLRSSWTRLTGGSRRRSVAPIGSYGASCTEAQLALLIIASALDRHLGDMPHVGSTRLGSGPAGMNVPRLNFVRIRPLGRGRAWPGSAGGCGSCPCGSCRGTRPALRVAPARPPRRRRTRG